MKSKRRSVCKRHLHGMTLIEVLVALIILGMAMAAIMRINATSLRNHQVSKDYQEALRVAESRLEAMGVDSTSLTLQESGLEANEIRWEFSRRPYHHWSDERLQVPWAIPVEERIRVMWGESSFPRELSFSRIQLIFPE